MIDFFHKDASMTKKITGMAKLKGLPKVNPHRTLEYTRIGTFYDEEYKIANVLLAVADTDESRRNGLMGVDSLPDICGMLFEGLSGGGYFWMKDCLIPLDVAFMNKYGAITRIYSMPVDKEGKERYEYDDNDVSAVEVPRGFFKDNGIAVGFELATRSLSSGKEDDNG